MTRDRAVATVRLTVAPGRGALPRHTSGASATASGRSSSPAASASSATATSPASARRCCRTSSPTARTHLPYVLARNEQAMVHTSVAYARQKDRLQTWACTASVGPGSTNMLTGAALATINRIPVLLLPSGTFATRVTGPVLQELEQPYAADVTVNDAFRPLSRFFDRVSRPEQLPSALLGAMRVLTDPVETGAVTIALPQDVQAEAHDWPVELFAPRIVARGPSAARGRRRRRRRGRRSAPRERPLVVAGGGVHYSGAEEALRAFCEAHRHPRRRDARPARARCRTGTRRRWARSARPARRPPTRSPREADVVIGVGTRWSDFTTASRTAFQDNGVRFVNLNVARFDAGKHAGLSVVADAREALDRADRRPRRVCRRRRLPRAPGRAVAEWDAAVEAAYHPAPRSPTASPTGLLTQGQVLGAVNELTDPRDVVLCAAGSMPGDLHKLWRVRDRKALPRRVRLLLHGLRGAGVDRHPARRRDPRRLRHGRRRRLPHDADRARHRGAGAGQGDRRARAEPRLPLDRLAVGVARLAALRHELPLPRRGVRAARRRRAARRPGRQRPRPRRARHRGALARRARSRRSRRPRRLPPTAARSSSTSRPTRSSTRPTARRGGTCRSRRSPTLDSTQTASADVPRDNKRSDPFLAPARGASTATPRPPARRASSASGRMGADHAERIARASTVLAWWRCPTRRPSGPESCRHLRRGARRRRRPRLIADDEVDAVVVASPGFAHEEQVLACLQAAKPVLCEKPLTLDSASSLRLVEMEAKGARPLVQVGFMRRFDPEYAELNGCSTRVRSVGP